MKLKSFNRKFDSNSDTYLLPIGGVPGVGKSTVLSYLSTVIECKSLETSELALKLNIIKKDPSGRDTFVITNFTKMFNYIKSVLKKKCVLLTSVYPQKIYEAFWRKIPFIIILRANPKDLETRLMKKTWIRPKILENILAEALGSIYDNADESFIHSIIEVDTTGKNINEIIDRIFDKVDNNEFGREIDWLLYKDIVEKVSLWLSELDSYKYGLPK